MSPRICPSSLNRTTDETNYDDVEKWTKAVTAIALVAIAAYTVFCGLFVPTSLMLIMLGVLWWYCLREPVVMIELDLDQPLISDLSNITIDNSVMLEEERNRNSEQKSSEEEDESHFDVGEARENDNIAQLLLTTEQQGSLSSSSSSSSDVNNNGNSRICLAETLLTGNGAVDGSQHNNEHEHEQQQAAMVIEDYSHRLEEEFVSDNSARRTDANVITSGGESSLVGEEQMWSHNGVRSEKIDASRPSRDDEVKTSLSQLELKEARREIRLVLTMVIFVYRVNNGRKYFLDAQKVSR